MLDRTAVEEEVVLLLLLLLPHPFARHRTAAADAGVVATVGLK
jgi:hypothetical protein